MSAELSLVQDFGLQASPCGYCHSEEDTSHAHGMIAEKLSVQDYQDLIDLGWRRSGTYLYKPIEAKTCCPPYTIRQAANQFCASKDQSKLLKKLSQYLDGRGPPLNLGQPASTQPVQQSPARGVVGSDGKTGQQQGQHALQQRVSEALCTVLSVSVEVLQCVGLLPSKLQLPPIRVFPRVDRASKRRHSDCGAPTASTLELCSPCCLALSAATQRSTAAATQDTNTTTTSAPSGQKATKATGKTRHSDSGATQHAVQLSEHVAQAVQAVLHHLGPAGDHAATPSAPCAPSVTAPAWQAAVQAAAKQIQTHLVSAQQPMECDINDSRTQEEGTEGSQVQHVLQACQVSTAAGYINFSMPTAAVRDLTMGRGAEGSSAHADRKSTRTQRASREREPSPVGTGARHSRLEVVTVRSQFIEEEYQLYKRYQMAVHEDTEEEADETQYTRFLVDSPLTAVQPPHTHSPQLSITVTAADAMAAATQHSAHQEQRAGSSRGSDAAGSSAQHSGGAGGDKWPVPSSAGQGQTLGCIPEPPCGYGSYHMQYRVDGRLVAVGVVDILPRCLSSVYLFWDPDLKYLSLGKLSALYELLWVQQASKVCPGLQWYYMGFYIHSCHKMRYKADYRPSDLLCPENKVWVRLEAPLLAAIDHSPVVALSTQPGATVYRNWAHTDTEAAAVAGRLGLQLPASGADSLAPMVQPAAGRGTELLNNITAPVGRRGQSGSKPQAHGAAGSSRLGGEGSATQAAAGILDVKVHLWNLTLAWRELRQQITDAGVKLVTTRLEKWLPLVGSVGGRVVYNLG